MSVSFAVEKVESLGVSWPYHMFNSFRHRIARSCGLKDVYANTETDMYKTGRYKELGDSPIYPFIEHSDCDGEMGPEECGPVGAYLKVLIEEWLGEDPQEIIDIKNGKRLAEAMLKCHEKGETLLFL
jgi:hypothetical protein